MRCVVECGEDTGGGDFFWGWGGVGGLCVRGMKRERERRGGGGVSNLLEKLEVS